MYKRNTHKMSVLKSRIKKALYTDKKVSNIGGKNYKCYLNIPGDIGVFSTKSLIPNDVSL